MIVNIAKDFSPFPAGRFRSDGRYSGQRFREDLLVPALKEHDSVIVELDGVEGFGSSFLEEVFGGLVRLEHFTPADVRRRLKVSSSDPAFEAEIWGYIESDPD